MGIILRKFHWFSFIKLLSVGVILGIIGLGFAPTTLCTSLCDKFLGASIFSLTVNLIILLLAILWLKGNNRENSV